MRELSAKIAAMPRRSPERINALLDAAEEFAHVYAFKSLAFQSLRYLIELAVTSETQDLRLKRMTSILKYMPDTQHVSEEQLLVWKNDIKKFRQAFIQDKDKVKDATVHWAHKKKLVDFVLDYFDNPCHVILYGQSNASGFDHREIDDAEAWNLIDTKAKAISRNLGRNIRNSEAIADTPYCIPLGRHVISGRGYSTISFWHGRFYFSILEGLKAEKLKLENLKILEFGGGYGNLARILLASGVSSNYVIVDLPESLVFSYSFLKMNFPELRVLLYSGESEIAFSEYDIVLLPFECRHLLANREFDLVVNTGSLQEMPRSTAESILEFIQNDIATKYFFSVNYTLTIAELHKELQQFDPDDTVLVAPMLDANWDVVDFQLNPYDIILDSPRNWLKVFLRRNRDGSRDLPEIPDQKWTQKWFSAVWGRLWRQPDIDLIDDYVAGIQHVLEGKTRIPVRIQKGVVSGAEKTGEVIFWRRVRERLLQEGRQ